MHPTRPTISVRSKQLKWLPIPLIAGVLLAGLMIALGALAPIQVQAQGSDFCTQVEETGISQLECEALVALRENTNVEGWTIRTGWTETNRPCEWYGVTCTNGHVGELVLARNNLSGTISALEAFTALRTLNLSYNPSLAIQLPATSASSLNLKELRLHGISSGFPQWIGDLQNLVHLELSGNLSIIPDSLGTLTGLQELNLLSDQFTGPLPATLSELKNLRKFVINGPVIGPTPNLTEWESCVEITILNTRLEGELPRGLSECGPLSILQVQSNPGLRGPISSTLNPLPPPLTILRLTGNAFEGNIPNLAQLTELHWLAIDGNKIEGEIPPSVGSLTKLVTLTLANNLVSGEIPPSLIALSDTLHTLNVNYNMLTATEPVSTMVKILNPDWEQTQTVPPKVIHITKVTTTSVTLGWAPIHYTGDGGGYQVDCAITPGGPYVFQETTESGGGKAASGITLPLPDLETGRTYYCAVRTHTPPHFAQPNDLMSVYSSKPVTIAPIHVEDENGNSVVGALVQLYRGGQLIDERTSDTNGHVFFPERQASDLAVASSIVYTHTLTKDAKVEAGPHQGWAWRVTLRNTEILSNGVVLANSALLAPTLVVNKTSAVIEFNLVVSVEFNTNYADPQKKQQFLNELEAAFIQASQELSEATDGQFVLGRVVIYDNAAHWADADIYVLADSSVIPHADVYGVDQSGMHVYLGRFWDRQAGHGSWSASDGYRTIIHELGHYLFGLYDSYTYRAGVEGEKGEAASLCEGLMAIQYEPTPLLFAMRAISPWVQLLCEQTEQWEKNNKSDWETIVEHYSDRQGLLGWTEQPRWYLRTPLDVGQQITEPLSLELPSPQLMKTSQGKMIMSLPPVLQVAINTASTVQVILIKKEGDTPVKIISMGEIDVNQPLTLENAEVGDVVMLVDNLGLQSASYKIGATDPPTLTVPLTKTVWSPTVDIEPSADGQGLSIKLTDLGVVLSDTVDAIFFLIGGEPAATRLNCTEEGSPPVLHCAHTFLLPPGQSVARGYSLIRAKSKNGGDDVETTSSFTLDLVDDDPTSHFRPRTSFDGKLRLEIEAGSLSVDTLLAISTIQITQRGDGVISAGASQQSSLIVPPLPDNVVPVSTLYNIRASMGITAVKPLTLQITYDQQVLESYTENAAVILHLDETTNSWMFLPTTRTVNEGIVRTAATTMTQMGVYGVFIQTTSDLSPGQNAVKYTRTQPATVAAAMSNCPTTDVYFGPQDTTDRWQKYVPGAPSYVSDLLSFLPDETYQLMVNSPCTIDFGRPLAALPISAAAASTSTSDADLLPVLPAGLYGEVTADVSTVEVCLSDGLPDEPRSNRCTEVETRPFTTAQGITKTVYTIDVEMDTRMPMPCKIEAGIFTKSTICKAGETTFIPMMDVYLPVIYAVLVTAPISMTETQR